MKLSISVARLQSPVRAEATPSRRKVIGQWCLVAFGGAALVWIILRGWNNATYAHADISDFYWGADAARRGTDMYQAGDGG